MKEQDFRVYGYRWVVLAIYGLCTGVIQLMWTTFFSITTDAWKYYGFTDAAKGESAISLLSIIFMAGMIIVSIPSLAAFERFGFKKAVGFGVVLTGICALLRGIFGESYTLVLAVTIGFAISQPFLLNSPGLVAGKWFPERERATANSVGLLCSYFGMCVGLLLTPILLEAGMTIRQMLLTYGVVGIIAAALFVIFVKEKPPTPPCPEDEAGRSDFKEGIRFALKKKNFILALLMFFCVFGVFNTFFTMIEPILRNLTNEGVDATQVGIIGVIILGVGIIGSLIISVISDKDKQHRRLPYMIIVNIFGCIGFALFLAMNGFGGLAVAAALYGFFIVGGAPLTLTFAAESCYPTSEGTSEGLLMFAGNVAGVIFLGGAALFGGNHRMLMITMIAVTIFYIVLMFFAKEVKLEKRQEH
ncbi:MFS transporter [Anaerovorax odorimutans]|uniref:MFS transporter n=1 Tax=Anaerovorax odorimutans TaxID=109327 RepID=A0ABT1RTB9_9FIRM|nr:MFS transporter [Anaerovorax odorimutans]MCQ4638386.1 MFS transporter [Anaerovorax odorimutans]